MDTRKHTRKETTRRPNNSQGEGHKLALKTHKEPGCKASWEKRLKLETEIPWREIGRNIAHGIGTKKELLVQKHTTQSHVPKRNNHNHQNNTMHLMWKKP